LKRKILNTLNVPYFELLDGIDAVKDRIPTDKEIVVVCAKGGSSAFVAEQLEEAGFDNVYTLVDGMKAWSEHLHQAKVYKDDKIKVNQFIRVGKGCLSYMVISGNEALVVDPSRFIDVYENVAKEEGINITHIVDSHLHADHISGGRALAERTGVKYYLMQSEGAVFDFEPLEAHRSASSENTRTYARKCIVLRKPKTALLRRYDFCRWSRTSRFRRKSGRMGSGFIRHSI
jgi:beta-lactamase superfamily II metal-dependent hydrolase